MAGKGGKKERREERLRDITQDSSGRMVYTGELWRIADSGGPGSALRQRMLLIAGLGVLALIVLGYLLQNGRQPAARHAPVGIEIDHNGAWTDHFPVLRIPVGNHFSEIILVNRVDSVDGVTGDVKLLSAGANGQHGGHQQ